MKSRLGRKQVGGLVEPSTRNVLLLGIIPSANRIVGGIEECTKCGAVTRAGPCKLLRARAVHRSMTLSKFCCQRVRLATQACADSCKGIGVAVGTLSVVNGNRDP